MSKVPSSPNRRRRAWTRLSIIVAFGGGIVAGMVLQTGLEEGWNPTLYIVGSTALVLLIVANLVAVRRFPGEDEPKPLPGEVYGDREKPKAHEVQGQSLDGRVPFGVSKNVAKKQVNPEVSKLYKRLDELNKELQRANVKLGLGQISKEGYTMIVQDLKERRAKVERKLTQVDNLLGDS